MADVAAPAPAPQGAAPGGAPGIALLGAKSLLERCRNGLFVALSFILTSVVVGNAYFQRQQFYPSVVYITKSNPSMAIIYFQAFIFVVLFGKLMRKVFFGRLRAAEFEHLMEGSWYAVTETCLAFTVFKDDVSPKFIALFTVLLFLKSFHWLSEGRVDFMERSPSISFLFHLRVLALAVLLAAVDLQFIMHAYTSTLTKGPSVQLVFGFEYAILLTIVANTMVKYVLHTIDLYGENPWENKAVFMLYTELAVGFVKVILYFVFIGIMVRIYTLPLFAVRPMYLTMRAFKKAFNDVILSRRAISNMNNWYPDATEEELANTDNVCIICREEMAAPSTKKLPCNHIFHKNCLRSWFQRQQTCPTCRLDVLRHSAQRQARQNQQNQQNQQPQMPQMPQMPAGFDNMFAQHMAAMRQHMQQHAAALPGAVPAPAAAAPGVVPPAAAGAAPGAAAAPGAPAAPVFMPPMPGMPGMAGMPQMPGMPAMFPPFFAPPPFNVPPPMPPANFNGLTDGELQAMEGTERANVEARIRVLRNIQVLLDAAVMEMQQYSSVIQRHPVPAVTPTVTPTAPEAATTTATTASTPAEAGAAANVTAAPAAAKETGAKPKVKVAAAAPVVTEADTKDAEEIVSKMDSEPKTEEELSKDKEQDELRRRRVAKFDSPTSS